MTMRIHVIWYLKFALECFLMFDIFWCLPINSSAQGFFSSRFAFAFAMFTILLSVTQLINSTTLVHNASLSPTEPQNSQMPVWCQRINAIRTSHRIQLSVLDKKDTVCRRPLNNTHRDLVSHTFIAKSSYNILMSTPTSKPRTSPSNHTMNCNSSLMVSNFLAITTMSSFNHEHVLLFASRLICWANAINNHHHCHLWQMNDIWRVPMDCNSDPTDANALASHAGCIQSWKAPTIGWSSQAQSPGQTSLTSQPHFSWCDFFCNLHIGNAWETAVLHHSVDALHMPNIQSPHAPLHTRC